MPFDRKIIVIASLLFVACNSYGQAPVATDSADAFRSRAEHPEYLFGDHQGDTPLQTNSADALPTFGNTCADGGDLGMLSSVGGLLIGNNLAATNDYGDDGGPTDGKLGPCQDINYRSTVGSGGDVIAGFTVDTTGPWTFTTCPNIGFSDGGFADDSSLNILEGGACPGTISTACNGGSCFSGALIRHVNLVAGTQYFLIVDSWKLGNGGDFGVRYVGPCSSDQECTDRDGDVFCNGVESCSADGICSSPGDPCFGTGQPVCYEDNRQCVVCDTSPESFEACGDDGLECNGIERCDPDVGHCVVDRPCGGRKSKCWPGQCGDGSGTPCEFDYHCDGDGDGLPDAPCVIDTNTATCEDADPCLVYWTVGRFEPWHNGGELVADDVQLSDVSTSHAGRDLISYEVVSICNAERANPPLVGPYDVTIQLWSTVAATPNFGLPDAPIPGTTCAFKDILCGVGGPIGTTGRTTSHTLQCSPNGGLPSGIILPETASPHDADLWITYKASTPAASISGSLSGAPIVMTTIVGSSSGCTISGGSEGGLGWFGCSFIGSLPFTEVKICTQIVGPCCLGASGCAMLSESACGESGGTYLGDNSVENPIDCADGDDGDGIGELCDNCLNVANSLQLDCDNDGQGDACEADENDQDRDLDGVCNGVDACPDDGAKALPADNSLGGAPGQCGCGIEDVDTDLDGTADCIDGCPLDLNKTLPGQCGCGVSESTDEDGDGVLDCVDRCRGADDALFAPECETAIPAVGTWGLVVLTLLLLAIGKIYFGGRRQEAR